jgi:hypothetical protein
MCEFTDNQHKNAALNFISGKSREEVVPRHVQNKFKYSLQPGRCPRCGKVLSRSERKPKGRATRSMCVECYASFIASHIDSNCFVCDMGLPDSKIIAQQKEPREVQHHLHGGACTHCWTLIHNVAVEEPDTINQAVQLPYQNQLALPPPEEKFRVPFFGTYKGKRVKVLR